MCTCTRVDRLLETYEEWRVPVSGVVGVTSWGPGSQTRDGVPEGSVVGVTPT